MRNICLLGATGSIGTQVLDIVRNHPEQCRVKAISFNQNLTKAIPIIEEFKPSLVACGENIDIGNLRQEFPGVEFVKGMEGFWKLRDIRTKSRGHQCFGRFGRMFAHRPSLEKRTKCFTGQQRNLGNRRGNHYEVGRRKQGADYSD